MSKIGELIANYCPGRVDIRQLSEIGEFIRGSGLQKSDLRDSGVPAVHYGQLHTHYGVWAEATKSFTDEATAAKLRRARPGDLLIATTSEDDDAVAKATAWLGGEDVVLSGDAYIYRHHLDPKYVSYFFQSTSFDEQKRKHISGTKVRRISGAALGTIRIPVPSLDVQREIVQVLDQFTRLEAELKAELEAELEARRCQYEYYRVVLLKSSDDAGVRDVSLGEIIRLNFGARITKKDNAGTIYPVYGGGGESFRTDAFNREDEWVVSRFAMSANCVRRVTGKFWMLDSGFTFDVIDASVDKDFVGQLFLSMQPIIFTTSTQSAQKNIDVDGFRRLRVQLPSLEVQGKVASALANFDGILNNLSSGLSAELDLRRKQYEYHRDLLLTFEEAR
ncbi:MULTISPECIES: restriction endonuclease subunit S [unclassified Rathayibacter]|uniref:restriction endonuclease subunit S n=1 Tax=unclassified Rathayibacter TaxID=2609250 RepID=UPI000CE84D69|nr:MULTISPECIES: restriction endonuclease subunit S [unclassified Rathayibacter]PPH78302.1 restriction endonuclease subunit S [Rathayibacter sp. AY1D4]PPH94358.1 restriction endonuclease subunit S [Rathayibacter sp. AY1D3]